MAIRIFELLIILAIIYAISSVCKKIIAGINDRKLKKLDIEKENTRLVLETLRETTPSRIKVVIDSHRTRLSKDVVDVLENHYSDMLIQEDANRFVEKG